MATSSDPDRTAVVSGDVRLTTQQLSDLADGGAGLIARSQASHVVYVGLGGAMLPLLIFASARAGVAFTPINYRLSAEGIKTLIARLPDPLVVVDGRYLDELGGLDGPAGLETVPSRSSCPTTFWRRPATPNRPRSSPTRTRSASCCSRRAPRRSPRPSSSPTTT